MRIQGPNGAAGATAPVVARRQASGTFSISEQEETRSPAQSAALRAVSSLDALIALQGVGDPTERRKRAVRQGRSALDALESLKVGLLGGDLDSSTLGRLKSVAEGLKESSGDPRLDAVLAEIGLRVEVELAKAGRRQPPA